MKPKKGGIYEADDGMEMVDGSAEMGVERIGGTRVLSPGKGELPDVHQYSSETTRTTIQSFKSASGFIKISHSVDIANVLSIMKPFIHRIGYFGR